MKTKCTLQSWWTWVPQWNSQPGRLRKLTFGSAFNQRLDHVPWNRKVSTTQSDSCSPAKYGLTIRTWKLLRQTHIYLVEIDKDQTQTCEILLISMIRWALYLQSGDKFTRSLLIIRHKLMCDNRCTKSSVHVTFYHGPETSIFRRGRKCRQQKRIFF